MFQRFAKLIALRNRPSMWQANKVLSTESPIAKNPRLQYFKDMFKRLDTNEDGLISKEDLRNGLLRCLDVKPSEDQLQKAMEILRPGNKGFVDLEDLVQYYMKKKLPNDDDLKKEFFVIDKDHDVFVSEKDLRDWYDTIEDDSLQRLYDKYLPCEMKMCGEGSGRINVNEYIELSSTLFLLASVFDLPVYRETFP